MGYTFNDLMQYGPKKEGNTSSLVKGVVGQNLRNQDLQDTYLYGQYPDSLVLTEEQDRIDELRRCFELLLSRYHTDLATRLFSCSVPRPATYNMAQRTYAQPYEVNLTTGEAGYGVIDMNNYTHVCVNLSKMLYWFKFGYTIRFEKLEERREVYFAIQRILSENEPDPMELVTLEMNAEIITKLEQFAAYIKKTYPDVIPPKESIKPFGIPSLNRFKGFYVNDTSGYATSRETFVNSGPMDMNFGEDVDPLFIKDAYNSANKKDNNLLSKALQINTGDKS